MPLFMTKEERIEMIELMDALTELSYGVMLQVGTQTATKLVSAAQKLKCSLEENCAKNQAKT